MENNAPRILRLTYLGFTYLIEHAADHELDNVSYHLYTQEIYPVVV